MSTKKKFYAVKVGRVPGVYPSYPECYQQIKGVSNAIHGSFPTIEEAEAYLQGAEETEKDPSPIPEGTHYDIFTGGSFKEGNFFSDVRYSSAFVVYETDKLIHIGKAEGTDKEAVTENHGITGEIEAVTNAVIWAEGQGIPSITIHYSFTGIAEYLP